MKLVNVSVNPVLERYCVVALFDALDIGHRFERSEWPAHVTLASNFVVSAAVDQIIAAVRDAMGVDRVLAMHLGECALFGPRADVPVRLVTSAQVDRVHRGLADRLDRLDGFAADEPTHWRAGYRPHLTLGPTVDAFEGEVRTATHVAIAKLTSATAEIVARLDLRPSQEPSLRAVGFDLDGTLFDHRSAAVEAVRELMTELGYEPTPDRVSAWFDLEAEHFESWRAGVVTFNEQRRRRLRDFLGLLGANRPVADSELDQLFETYLTQYRRAWRAFPGVESVLRDLRARGMRIGVLTNGNHEQQIDKLRVTGLAQLIDVVCTSEDLGVAKPDPRAFAILAARLECATSEMVFIGDNLDLDVIAARSAGIAAAQVRHGLDGPAALEDAVRSVTL